MDMAMGISQGVSTVSKVRCSLWILWRVWLWTWTPCLLPGIWTWIWLWAWIWILWLNYLIQQIRSGIKMAMDLDTVLTPWDMDMDMAMGMDMDIMVELSDTTNQTWHYNDQVPPQCTMVPIFSWFTSNIA